MDIMSGALSTVASISCSNSEASGDQWQLMPVVLWHPRSLPAGSTIAMLSSTEYRCKPLVGSRWCWTPQPAWLLVRAGVTIFCQSCMMSSIHWLHSGFSSRLRLRIRLHASVASVQPTSKTSAPQRSTLPVEQTTIRPIAVTLSSREPGHNTADETSVLLLQLSGTLFLFICARLLSVEDIQTRVEIPSLQSSLCLWERFVLRVNLLTYLLMYVRRAQSSIIGYFGFRFTAADS